jgi:sulfur carrier protein
MRIVLNGEAVEGPPETLEAFLLRHDFEATIVATAVNGDFVPRDERAAKVLADGDEVAVFSPRQGG